MGFIFTAKKGGMITVLAVAVTGVLRNGRRVDCCIEIFFSHPIFLFGLLAPARSFYRRISDPGPHRVSPPPLPPLSHDGTRLAFFARKVV